MIVATLTLEQDEPLDVFIRETIALDVKDVRFELGAFLKKTLMILKPELKRRIQAKWISNRIRMYAWWYQFSVFKNDFIFRLRVTLAPGEGVQIGTADDGNKYFTKGVFYVHLVRIDLNPKKFQICSV